MLNWKTAESTSKNVVTSVLKDLKVIRKPSGKAHVVGKTTNKVDMESTNPLSVYTKLSWRLASYNTKSNFKGFYHLLNKLDVMQNGVPTPSVYEQIFKSLYLMSSKESSKSLAQFALKMIVECHHFGLNLSSNSWLYLDAIIASSDLIQQQLQYQVLRSKYDDSMRFMIRSGQYERCIEKFYERWQLEKSTEVLKELSIVPLILLSISRLDSKQALELMKILNNYSLLIDPHRLSKIIVGAAVGGDYQLCLYCYNEYIKDNERSFSLSLLRRFGQIFAKLGDSETVLKLISSMELNFHTKMDSENLSIALESYCSSRNYRAGWGYLSKIDDINLNKTDFENLIRYYPFLRQFRSINSIVKDAQSIEFSNKVEDVVYYTIFKKIHNDTNFTGMVHLLNLLYETGKEDQIFKNYSVVIHAISRSNSAKLFTLKFYKLLKTHNIELSSIEYYHLLQNSLFSNGADDYTLTKFFIEEQLKYHNDLTPMQLKLLQSITNDQQILKFLELYLTENLHGDNLKSDDHYRHLLTYDLQKILDPSYPKNTKVVTNYNHHYDMKNSQFFDHIGKLLYREGDLIARL